MFQKDSSTNIASYPMWDVLDPNDQIIFIKNVTLKLLRNTGAMRLVYIPNRILNRIRKKGGGPAYP